MTSYTITHDAADPTRYVVQRWTSPTCAEVIGSFPDVYGAQHSIAIAAGKRNMRRVLEHRNCPEALEEWA